MRPDPPNNSLATRLYKATYPHAIISWGNEPFL